MTILRRCLRAAFLLTTLVVAASLPTGSPLGLGGSAWGQSKSVEAPAYRQLGASEAMASPGQSGPDYSANSPSLAGLTLLALYGPGSPFGVHLAYTRAAVLVALLFVTLPFVVRAVQPVLLELDTEMEEAAASLGARPVAIFRRVVMPNILPAILSGVALAFARSIGEFGAVVLISGNLPFKTEVASVYIFGQIESGNVTGAAAVSSVLLTLSLAVLLGIGAFRRWKVRHDVY